MNLVLGSTSADLKSSTAYHFNAWSLIPKVVVSHCSKMLWSTVSNAADKSSRDSKANSPSNASNFGSFIYSRFTEPFLHVFRWNPGRKGNERERNHNPALDLLT